jgi:transposase
LNDTTGWGSVIHVSEILVPRAWWRLEIPKIQKIQKIPKTLSSSPTRSQSLLYSPWTYIVYRTISPDMKQRAVYLLLEEGWEIDQITTTLGVHSKSIERWEHTNENRASVNPPIPLRGCRRLLNGDIAEGLHEMLIESSSLLLDKIGGWLAIYRDQIISTTALHDNLKDLGLTYKRLKRITTDEQVSSLPPFPLLSSSPPPPPLLACSSSLPLPLLQP